MTMNTFPIVKVENVIKSYGQFRLNVSFEIFPGQTLALIGPNASGKTSLIYSLLNIVRRDSGRIQIFGSDLDKNEVAIKSRTGVVFESPRLFDSLLVRDLLTLYRSLYTTWDQDYAQSLLDDLEVETNKRCKQLSKGTRTKIALILALASKPQFLILDEPTAGLDPQMRRLFVQQIRSARVSFSPAILLTSHIMKDIEDLADQVAFINNGQIKLISSLAELDRWRIVEGKYKGSDKLNFPGQQLFVGEDGFRIWTKDNEDTLLSKIREQGGEVIGVSKPDLEEVFEWVLSANYVAG